MSVCGSVPTVPAVAKPLDVSERVFQDQVEQIARMNGWQVFHPAPHQVRAGVWRTDGQGFPDLVMSHPNRGTMFVELKAAKGIVSETQWAWIHDLEDSGEEVHVWRPADMQLIATRLAGYRS